MNNSSPKISIILPTYNGERWITDAIDSILGQTEGSWELIVIDDASSDNTYRIVKRYADRDDRIRLIRNPVNRKLPASLNIGFRNARGKYYTWTSDDNRFKPDALEKLSDCLDNNSDVALVAMNADVIDENGVVLGTLDDHYKYKKRAEHLLFGSNVGAAFMYRKEAAQIVGDYDESLFCVEDYDYWMRFAILFPIRYTEDNVYEYRVHAGSLSATKKSLVRTRTLEVRSRYISAFTDRFELKGFDAVIAYARLPLRCIPCRYIIGAICLKLYKLGLTSVAQLITFNRQRSKSLYARYALDDHFSFQS